MVLCGGPVCDGVWPDAGLSIHRPTGCDSRNDGKENEPVFLHPISGDYFGETLIW